MNALEHAQFVTRMNNANSLTDVMVSALMTGKDEDGNDNVIQAGPKQVKALVERGFVSEVSHYLTEKGQAWYRAFSGQEITEEERKLLTETAVTSSSHSAGTFLVDASQADLKLMIRPAENGEGLPWADAKKALREHFLKEREFARKILQDLPKLRKAEVTENAQIELSDSEESDGDSEDLFSGESETVDA